MALSLANTFILAALVLILIIGTVLVLIAHFTHVDKKHYVWFGIAGAVASIIIGVSARTAYTNHSSFRQVNGRSIGGRGPSCASRNFRFSKFNADMCEGPALVNMDLHPSNNRNCRDTGHEAYLTGSNICGLIDDARSSSRNNTLLEIEEPVSMWSAIGDILKTATRQSIDDASNSINANLDRSKRAAESYVSDVKTDIHNWTDAKLTAASNAANEKKRQLGDWADTKKSAASKIVNETMDSARGSVSKFATSIDNSTGNRLSKGYNAIDTAIGDMNVKVDAASNWLLPEDNNQPIVSALQDAMSSPTKPTKPKQVDMWDLDDFNIDNMHDRSANYNDGDLWIA